MTAVSLWPETFTQQASSTSSLNGHFLCYSKNIITHFPFREGSQSINEQQEKQSEFTTFKSWRKDWIMDMYVLVELH